MTMSIAIDQIHIKQVLSALRQQGVRCPLESVEGLCSDLTTDQVFLAIDSLARSGQVCLTLDSNRSYSVTAWAGAADSRERESVA